MSVMNETRKPLVSRSEARQRMRLHAISAAVVFALLAPGCGGSPGGPSPPVVEGPAVHSITPNTGSTAGGTEVTIRGLRFGAGATVTIGGAAATDVVVQGADTISAKAPAAPSAGVVDVVVSVAGRSGALPGGFVFVVPPSNNRPVITAIVAQGTRPHEPPDFADVGVPIAVAVTVRDDETAADQLEYRWTATAGTFDGTGARVTWRPPDTASTPLDVTINVRVVEKYGPNGIFQHEVTGARSISLHDSRKELGDMAVRFLTEFSKPQTNRNVDDIMRDFSASVCPNPDEVDDEREDVITHYTNFTMNTYQVGAPLVQVNFRGRCFGSVDGDACIDVPVVWDSTDRRNMKQARTSGIDHLTGAYAVAGKRWWLCSSRYEQTGTFGHPFYSIR